MTYKGFEIILDRADIYDVYLGEWHEKNFIVRVEGFKQALTMIDFYINVEWLKGTK